MVAYLIAQGEVHDPELLARYAAEGGGSTIIQHGGTILAADESPEVVEGEWFGPRTVLCQFPSMEAARAWYRSPEYQKVIHLRHKGMTSNAIFLEGLDPAILEGLIQSMGQS